MLNNDTLKQFFIQRFFKVGMIRGVLERNLQTLAHTKRAMRDIKHIEKDYERLWQKEDESFLQFIPIRPRTLEGEPRKNVEQPPQPFADFDPRPLAVRKPVPLLALHAPRVDPHLEDVERKLGAS